MQVSFTTQSRSLPVQRHCGKLTVRFFLTIATLPPDACYYPTTPQWPASPRQAFVPVIAGYSAYAVVETMAREKGLRRVPVIDNRTDRKLLNLVTSSHTQQHASQ